MLLSLVCFVKVSHIFVILKQGCCALQIKDARDKKYNYILNFA